MAGWASAVLDEVNAALRFIGIDSILLHCQNIPEAFSQSAHQRFFCVDVNHLCSGRLDVPKFSLLVDHPCAHLADIANRPAAHELLGWVDASHTTEAAALGLPCHSLFLPHAGPDRVTNPAPIHDRDVGVFFAGSLAEPMDRAQFLAARPDMPAVVTHVIFDAVDEIQRTLEPAIAVFAKACAGHGIDPSSFTRAVFCRLVAMVHEIAEINRRNAVLEALPDVRVVVAANYLPKKLRDRPNLIYVGFVREFAAIRELMARSKIVLNSTSKFPQGAHERIWYGMAEGAALLTDRSVYMESDFTHGAEILYLPLGSLSVGNFDEVKGLLHDTAALERIVDKAGTIYDQKHTWKRRIAVLHDAIRAAA